MFKIAGLFRETLSTVTTNYRLHLLAAVWIPSVGVGAYGLSRLAPDGEAAGGVVLAAIALGAYRLTGWALDLLAPFVVERLVWPLLGGRHRSNGTRGPAFDAAARVLHHSGHDIHFGKRPELMEEIRDIEKHLYKIMRELERRGRESSSAGSEYANLSPMRKLKVPAMYDLSPLLENGKIDEDALHGVIFEMPDGSHWKVPHHAAPFGSAEKSGYGRQVEIRKMG